MRMSTEVTPRIHGVFFPRHRAYRIALTVSLILNVLLAGALYLYSTVESFMSVIGMAVGILG